MGGKAGDRGQGPGGWSPCTPQPAWLSLEMPLQCAEPHPCQQRLVPGSTQQQRGAWCCPRGRPEGDKSCLCHSQCKAPREGLWKGHAGMCMFNPHRKDRQFLLPLASSSLMSSGFVLLQCMCSGDTQVNRDEQRKEMSIKIHPVQ